MRDLAIHGDDLIVATHGRSFWILDVTSRPLRQMNAEIAKESAHLFEPQRSDAFSAGIAIRIRHYTAGIPRRKKSARRAPSSITTWLRPSAKLVTLEILDDQQHLVRRYASHGQIGKTAGENSQVNIPFRCIGSVRRRFFPRGAGMHRFVWDLHYAPPGIAGA